MKLYVENNESIPAIKVLQDSDPAPSGYTEKTSIEDWYKYGNEVLGAFFGFNYLTWRTEIFNLIIGIVGNDYTNWNNLNNEQKSIAIDLILAPYSLRVPTISDEQDLKNWNELIVISQGLPVSKYEGRAKIIEKMREAVSNELRTETMSKEDADLFYKDTFDLISYFQASNSPDFKQWLTNEVGTPYENNGFAQKIYYSITRKNYLLSIYQGNY
jgi:hypothetical protein